MAHVTYSVRGQVNSHDVHVAFKNLALSLPEHFTADTQGLK